MAHAAFNLQDSLVAYGDDKRAARLPHSLSELGDAMAGCIFGLVEIDDHASVHADYWECHPEGDEILCVLEGRLRVAVERGGMVEEIEVGRGQVCIVPRARWHRLQVLEPGRLLFLTPAAGTRLRPHIAQARKPESTTQAGG